MRTLAWLVPAPSVVLGGTASGLVWRLATGGYLARLPGQLLPKNGPCTAPLGGRLRQDGIHLLGANSGYARRLV